jgi:hypothetical protein
MFSDWAPIRPRFKLFYFLHVKKNKNEQKLRLMCSGFYPTSSRNACNRVSHLPIPTWRIVIFYATHISLPVGLTQRSRHCFTPPRTSATSPGGELPEFYWYSFRIIVPVGTYTWMAEPARTCPSPHVCDLTRREV